MKRFALILLSVILVFSCIEVCADELVTEESTDILLSHEEADESSNIIRFVLIGGSVIGALCAITLLYKKKDEIRYL